MPEPASHLKRVPGPGQRSGGNSNVSAETVKFFQAQYLNSCPESILRQAPDHFQSESVVHFMQFRYCERHHFPGNLQSHVIAVLPLRFHDSVAHDQFRERLLAQALPPSPAVSQYSLAIFHQTTLVMKHDFVPVHKVTDVLIYALALMSGLCLLASSC